MDYALIKTLHILSSTLLFGTGLGTAFFFWFAHRSGDARVIAGVSRLVVRADWVFTAPTIVIQPLTGLWLANAAGIGWPAWLVVSIVLYVIAGACWLPVVWLQIQLREFSTLDTREGRPLPPRYHRYVRIWFWLGVPAFLAMVATFYLMTAKPTFG